MSGKKKQPSAPSATTVRTKLESFVMIEVHRSSLMNAPYNPRDISESAKRKLKAGIAKLGLLAPITWNKRTGNIVGGHQRLKALDAINGGSDYTLNVAAVDLNDIQEKEANLLLNNEAAMGFFDIDKLGPMLSEPGLDIEAAGWDEADMFRLFGHDPRADKIEKVPGADLAETDDDSKMTVDAYKKAADRFNKAHEDAANEGLDDYYLVVVFPTYQDRKAFTDAMGLVDERYQSSKEICPAALAGRDKIKE